MFTRTLFRYLMKLLGNYWNIFRDKEDLSKKRFVIQSVFYNIYTLFWIGLCVYTYIKWHELAWTARILLEVLTFITIPTDISSFWKYDKWKKLAQKQIPV